MGAGESSQSESAFHRLVGGDVDAIHLRLSIDFVDAQHKTIQFFDSRGSQVYYVASHESVDRVIDWVWKEFLVSSAARGDECLTTSILDTIQSLSIEDDVFDLFPAHGSKSAFIGSVPVRYANQRLLCGWSEAMTRGHHELHNDHWTKDMKDAGARLLSEYKGDVRS